MHKTIRQINSPQNDMLSGQNSLSSALEQGNSIQDSGFYFDVSRNSDMLDNVMLFNKNKDVRFPDHIPFALTIGPQRSGTTWIDRYLRTRGDVCLPHQVKETFFFDKNHHKGLAYYRDHFDVDPAHKLMMEVSATAFHHPDAPQRVKSVFGSKVKLICPLRHPIPRSYSLYRHFTQYGLVHGNLDDAIIQRPDIITSSFYAQHLKRWFDVFGQENITVLFLEQLREDPENFTQSLCDGLGLDYYPPLKDMRRRKKNYAVKPPHPLLARMGQAGADFLRDIKAYDVINFGKKIGLKRLLFGTGKREEDVLLRVTEYEILNNHLSEEVEKLETLLGYKIPLWNGYDIEMEENRNSD